MEQSNAVSSPWLLNADATDPLSPISGLTNFMSGEEAQLIDAFSEPRSPQVPCRSDWYSDTGKPTLAIDHTHRRASRSLTPTSEAFDRIYDAQTLELNDANMLDSTSAVSFANTVNFSDTSSSESMFLRSDTNPTVTAASTPPTSGTAESPRISRSSSSKSISTPVRGHKTSHKARQVAVSASKNIMREDYLQYLRTEVSSWISGKQWLVNADVRPEQAPMEASTYTELELAYSTVCKLDTRISIDVIRSRVALIRLHREYVRTCDSWDASGLSKSATDVGRGKTSFIIDHILRRIHQDWHSLDSSAREQLRARFHSQKRFGKRWLLMMEALGPGILLICSHRLANMM
ncbi:hypothetical protein RRF57_001943 [Xylaria bambusicola]|uniref:Uncharacterized protein n=1 Tax=Xylaria bambusicola TaxID=326684 RepID=A0AAN7Z415_9PEZI